MICEAVDDQAFYIILNINYREEKVEIETIELDEKN